MYPHHLGCHPFEFLNGYWTCGSLVHMALLSVAVWYFDFHMGRMRDILTAGW